MAEIKTGFKRTIEIKADVEKVYALISDTEKVVKNLPRLKKFTRIKEDLYRWKFEPVGIGAFSVSLHYDTRFSTQENKAIRWESIPKSGNAEVKGEFLLFPIESGTRLELNLTLTTRLFVPLLLRPVARGVQNTEIENGLNKYLENIKGALEPKNKQ